MNEKTAENKIFTIPNILSMFRILLVPAFAIVYFIDSLPYHFYIAVLILGVSGLSDVLDGIIARKFNMVSTLGKILDPIADKLTQGTAVICISVRHYIVIPLLILFCAKELTMLLCSVHLMKSGARPSEAKWWGKLSTVVIFLFIVFVLATDIFPMIPMFLTGVFAVIAAICLLFSLFNYYPVFKDIQNGSYDMETESKIEKNNEKDNNADE